MALGINLSRNDKSCWFNVFGYTHSLSLYYKFIRLNTYLTPILLWRYWYRHSMGWCWLDWVGSTHGYSHWSITIHRGRGGRTCSFRPDSYALQEDYYLWFRSEEANITEGTYVGMRDDRWGYPWVIAVQMSYVQLYRYCSAVFISILKPLYIVDNVGKTASIIKYLDAYFHWIKLNTFSNQPVEVSIPAYYVLWFR